jgi:Kef-type K+ transport system membrane component KefB
MQELLEQLGRARDFFHENIFFAVGVLLLCGYFGGRLARKLKLPTISGYIVAGLLLGPSILNIVPDTIDAFLKPIPYLALGLIALAIGSQLSFRTLKSLGAGIAILTAVQLFVTFACVTIFTSLLGIHLGVALLLGAIASATAPAATVAVLTEFRARGPLTTTLMAVVALDDAGCVMLFGIASSIGAAISPGAGVRLAHMLLVPVAEILGAIALGAAVGPLLHLLVRRKRERRDILIIVLGAVLFCSGIAMELNLSPLIANMMVGFVFINASARNARIFRIIEPVEPPIYAAFFAIAGTELNLGALKEAGVVGIVYVASRALGKLLGATVGAVLGKASATVKQYIGLALLPQAGVAIGLSILAGEAQWLTSEQRATIISIVLAGVVVNELIGPPCTKFAIFKAGGAYALRLRRREEEPASADPTEEEPPESP